MIDKSHWPRVRFGDVVKLNKDRIADPAAEGIERYVGIEYIEPEDLRVRSWGLVADGTTFTNYFQPGQVLFVKRRAYQRKVAVADFSGVCSGDIYVLESKDPDVLLPDLLPCLCITLGWSRYLVWGLRLRGYILRNGTTAVAVQNTTKAPVAILVGYSRSLCEVSHFGYAGCAIEYKIT